jgi:hypothetical protein
MTRFLLCIIGAAATGSAGVMFSILEIPNDRAGFAFACGILVAVAVFWGRLAAKAPADPFAVRPFKLERGETYVLEIRGELAPEQLEQIRRQASRIEDRTGCRFLVLDRVANLVTLPAPAAGENGGVYD